MIRVKGHVIDRMPTSTKASLRLLLDVKDDGLLIWIPSDVLRTLPVTFNADVRECDVVITGKLTVFADSRRASMVACNLRARRRDGCSDLSVAFRKNTHPFLTGTATRPASPELKATDQASLRQRHRDRTHRPRNGDRSEHDGKGGSLIIHLSDFRIYIKANVTLDFLSRYDLSENSLLLGREILVKGKVIDFRASRKSSSRIRTQSTCCRPTPPPRRR